MLAMGMADAASAGNQVLAKGATIGRYLVLGLIGRGGMGEVYAAFDPELDRKIAVKLLRSRAADAEGRVRLLREAQAIARLSHPNVVVVYDVGTFEDQVFIAMEFVDGNTVGYWMKAGDHPVQDTLKIFEAAGRGLAAAHAAGMVHRDFKPDNVMITRDGQVRVMDFGLARQVEEKAPEPPSTSSGRMQDLMHLGEEAQAALDSEPVDLDATAKLGGQGPAKRGQLPAPSGKYLQQHLTQTGALVGTPAYMAPEQFASELTDARTDQFAFCIALYEALYGQRPFEGDNVITLMTSVVSGAIRAEPAATKVPARIRKVLLRGLEADPARRYPSINDLLADLAPEPAPRSRPWVVGLALAAVGVSAVLAIKQASVGGNTMCAGAPARLAGVWELAGASPRKEVIKRAFAGNRAGASIFLGLSTVLDAYVERWAAMYRDACEATHVRGEQSDEVLDLRMACLGDRLSSVKALTDIFAKAEGGVVESAVNAAGALPSLERCADVGMLRSVIPPPADQQTHQRVDALRTEIAKVRALGDAGQCTQALVAGRAALASATAIGYLPLKAEASYVVGRAGNFCDDSSTIGSLEEAVWAAEASRHDEVAVEAAAFVGGLNSDHLHDTKTARRWLSYADAILTRLPGHPMLQAYTDIAWGTLLQAEGRDEAAVERQQRALALKEQVLGPLHPDTALSAMNVGLAFHELGRDADGAPYSRRAVETLERLLGTDSAQVAIALYNEGEVLTGLGRLADARAALERAIAIWTKGGASPFFIALAQYDLARVDLLEKRPAEARKRVEGAIDVIAKSDAVVGGQARFVLAQTMTAPREQAPARALAVKARAEMVAAGAPAKKLVEVDAWLKDHAAE
jgi:serine/threonine protein kinase/tetratricopeptide (TPR) repeat protein